MININIKVANILYMVCYTTLFGTWRNSRVRGRYAGLRSETSPEGAVILSFYVIMNNKDRMIPSALGWSSWTQPSIADAALCIERLAINMITAAPGRGTFWADIGLRINCVTLCAYIYETPGGLPNSSSIIAYYALCNRDGIFMNARGVSPASTGGTIEICPIIIRRRATQANDRVIHLVSVNKILPGDIDRNWQIYSRNTTRNVEADLLRSHSCRDEKSEDLAAGFTNVSQLQLLTSSFMLSQRFLLKERKAKIRLIAYLITRFMINQAEHRHIEMELVNILRVFPIYCKSRVSIKEIICHSASRKKRYRLFKKIKLFTIEFNWRRQNRLWPGEGDVRERPKNKEDILLTCINTSIYSTYFWDALPL